MYNRKKSAFVRFMALLMILVTVLPMGAAAVGKNVQPRASAYLDNYTAYVYAAGSGLVQVWFNAEGTSTMDELGALSIKIYECSTNSSDINDWTWKETFLYDTTSGMLSYNDNYHSGHVDYQGVAGRYYKAYVCIWGGKNGNGDTRYFWTSAKKAT